MAHVLALIDGSVYAESVCDHAAWLARGLDAPVTILHVLGRREAGGLPLNLGADMQAAAGEAVLRELAEHEAERARMARKRADLILQAARERMVQDGIGDVTASLRHGDFVSTFEEFSGDAAMAVLGKRGEAADFARGHLGSNLERAVRASAVPLLVAARAFRPINRVAVAFDGRASAVRAASGIASLPMFLGCTVALLSVGPLDFVGQTAREEALAALAARGFSPEAIELAGDPAAAIAEHVESHGVDLLVMGAYGHSRLRSIVIGSITSELLQACRVPVLLFK